MSTSSRARRPSGVHLLDTCRVRARFHRPNETVNPSFWHDGVFLSVTNCIWEDIATQMAVERPVVPLRLFGAHDHVREQHRSYSFLSATFLNLSDFKRVVLFSSQTGPPSGLVNTVLQTCPCVQELRSRKVVLSCDPVLCLQGTALSHPVECLTRKPRGASLENRRVALKILEIEADVAPAGVSEPVRQPTQWSSPCKKAIVFLTSTMALTA